MGDACQFEPERTAYDVVAVAASAGGLNALTDLLAALPDDFPAAILVVQHVDPDHLSHMAEILDRRCRLRVIQACEGQTLAPGTVYIAPPDHHLLVGPEGTVSLTQTHTVHFVRPSADLLFESVAKRFGERAVAVVLTGSGVDGSMGIRAVKARGGVVLVQDEETSEHFGMPGAAIRTGLVDLILPLPRIASALLHLNQHGDFDMSQPEPGFEALLQYLKVSRGFDFTAYKRPTLMRRIHKRMSALHVEDYAGYQDHLEVHPDEFADLFNTILINVTDFFRDEPAWEYLRDEAIPAILDQKRPSDPIRVWSAGCASGEEAYSVAMLLAEALGTKSFAERVKIYATDVDEEALEQARRASFSQEAVKAVPDELREKYFERVSEHFDVDRELRRSVIFGRHDLLKDAPISRVDLLLCRNTLMYFNTEVQERILARFHFALSEGGFLVLGKAETQITRASIFAPANLKLRVFRQAARIKTRDRLNLMKNGDENGTGQGNGLSRLPERAFEVSPLAQMAVDSGGRLQLSNQQARSLFGINIKDIGRPLQDLEVSYRPVELRSLLDQAYSQRKPVQLTDVKWESPGRMPIYLIVDVIPISNGAIQGALISFRDMSESRRLKDELTHYNQELETAYEELQSTNEELQTTNEELQSTVEEVETTNEELQSTNEELETMNEELQSTNEGMEALNEELNLRSDELNRVNAFLRSVLSSVRDGMVVVDRDLQVVAWNQKAEELWGLRAEEVRGKHLLNLDFGLPVERMLLPIRACLSDGADHQDHGEITVQAVNRRGRAIQVRVTCSPLAGVDNLTTGAILQMEETEATAAEAV